MHNQTPTVRAHVFVDGQNLTYAARSAFGYPFANFDALALAKAACVLRGWEAAEVSFYTGIPCKAFNARQHRFWTQKLTAMRAQGINTIALPLKYTTTSTRRQDGTAALHHHAQEKGVDVRIAVDIINAAHEANCQAILLFSQDNDLREALLGAQRVAARAHRPIDIACAFPVGEHAPGAHGIKGIPEIPLRRDIYDACIDPVDHHQEAKLASRRAQAERAVAAREAIDSHPKRVAPALV